MGLSIADKRKFLTLAGKLSPENLSCDGERSPAEVRRRFEQLAKEWRQLEAKVGCRVTEVMAWGWGSEVAKADKAERQQRLEAALERFGDLPGLQVVRADDCHTSWRFDGGTIYQGSDERYAAFNIHKQEEGMSDFNDFQIPVRETGFKVSSEFSRKLDNKQVIGEFSTLEEAYQAGVGYLKTVTFEKYRANTKFSDPVIRRELRRLPEEMQANLELDAQQTESDYSQCVGFAPR